MTNQLTHQEKIQALTDKIDELLGGEIKEIKFGCELKSIDYDSVHIVLNKTEYADCAETIQKGYDLSSTQFINVKRDFEIIGRPIMATDILRAIEAFDSNSFYLKTNGDLIFITQTYEKETLCEINLSIPLHEQSERVVSDLYKLFFE